MIQRLKGNESGAALMIVLFIVVLVSIVGTAMLSTTTYGLQNVVKTKKEQEEFYRAEGALEILLTEMANYQNNNTNNSGPYGYLKDLAGVIRTYRIGEKEVKVEVSYREINATKLEVSLEAQYLNNNESKLSRIMNYQIDITTEELNRTEKIYNYEIPEGNIEVRIPNNIGTSVTNKLNVTTYDKITSELYAEENILVRQESNVDIQGNGETFIFENSSSSNVKEIIEVDLIQINGRDHKVIIPEGVIVQADLVDLRGSGDTSELIIEGVLIAKRIEHGGNSRIKVLSGLITKTAWANSESFVVNSDDAQGIDCKLVPSACKYINEERIYKSSIDKSSFDFSTNR